MSSHCPPVIAADGTLYVAGASGNVVALSAEGTIRWQIQTGGRCDGSPAIAEGGTVVAAMRDLHAIGPDGVELWRFPAPVDGLAGSPAIATDGTIYVSGEDSGLYALNADGSAKWHLPAQRRGKSSPAIASDGTVYLGADSKIIALTPGGAKKWETSLEDSEHLSPMIDRDGNIAAVVRDMLIFAPDGTTVTTIAADATSPQFPAALAPDGTWVLGAAGGLAKFDSSGVASWKVTAAGVALVPVIDVDGNVYVSDASCHVRSYDPAGQQRWTLEPAPGASCGGPVLGADGTLYLTSESAGILAIGD